jgi:hypothetical protein
MTAWMNRRPLAILVLVCLAAAAPALLTNVLLYGHDGPTHVRWQHFFASQLWQGEFYPRWLLEMNDGFGSPAFFVYPPLSHLVAAAFQPLTPDPGAIPARLAASIALSLAVGGAGVLLWLGEMVGRPAALVAALLYVLLPYHLAVDTYLRTAYAEVWAFAWFPWAFLAVHRTGRDPWLAGALLAASMAAVLLSHAPLALTLPPAILVYAGAVALIERRPVILAVTAGAMALSALLAAAYLATMLEHAGRIDQAGLFEGWYHLSNWLLFGPARWPSRQMNLLIGGVFLAQAGLSVVLAVIAAQGEANVRRWVWAPLVISTASLFMMTAWSAPVWHVVRILQRVQFPYRLLLLQSVALTALAGLAVQAAWHLSGRLAFWARSLTASGLVGLVLLNLLIGLFVVGNLRRQEPRSVAALIADSRDVREYVVGEIGGAAALFPQGRKAAVVTGDGDGDVAVATWQPRHLELEVDARTPLTVAVHQFAYAGWERAVDGDPPAAAGTCGSLPVVCVSLPQGRHDVTFELPAAWQERLGGWLSAGSMAALAIGVSAAVLRRRRTGEATTAAPERRAGGRPWACS